MCQFLFLSSVPYSFLSTHLFASLDRSIPRYCIIFVAMVNGIVSFISLSDFLLLVYRNARDFCIIILCLTNLLNSLTSFNSFLVTSSGFPAHSVSGIPWQFYHYFSNWDFLYFFWLPWLGLLRLCWMKVATVDILVLLLTLEEILSAFPHWVLCYL